MARTACRAGWDAPKGRSTPLLCRCSSRSPLCCWGSRLAPSPSPSPSGQNEEAAAPSASTTTTSVPPATSELIPPTTPPPPTTPLDPERTARAATAASSSAEPRPVRRDLHSPTPASSSPRDLSEATGGAVTAETVATALRVAAGCDPSGPVGVVLSLLTEVGTTLPDPGLPGLPLEPIPLPDLSDLTAPVASPICAQASEVIPLLFLLAPSYPEPARSAMVVLALQAFGTCGATAG